MTPPNAPLLILPYSGAAVAVFYDAEDEVIEKATSESVSVEEVNQTEWLVCGFHQVPMYSASVELIFPDGTTIRKSLKSWMFDFPFSFSIG